MKILLKPTDSQGYKWGMVIVWPDHVPDWAYEAALNDERISLLNWSGFENAIGFYSSIPIQE